MEKRPGEEMNFGIKHHHYANVHKFGNNASLSVLSAGYRHWRARSRSARRAQPWPRPHWQLRRWQFQDPSSLSPVILRECHCPGQAYIMIQVEIATSLSLSGGRLQLEVCQVAVQLDSCGSGSALRHCWVSRSCGFKYCPNVTFKTWPYW